MKKLCIAFALVMLAGTTMAQSLNKIPQNWRMARNYGAKNSDTLVAITNSLGKTNSWVVIFDRGSWDITNTTTIVFPTNLTLRWMPGTYFDMNAGSTVTVQGAVEALPFTVGTGGGVLNGSPNFLYRWPEWGTYTNVQWGFGESGISNWAEVVTTTNSFTMDGGTWGIFDNLRASNFFVDVDARVTNDLWVGGDVNIGGDLVVTGNITGATGTFTTVIGTIAGTITNINNAYITGAWPLYVDSDTVTIGTGEGWCNQSFFALTNSTNIDLTSIGSTTGFSYVYLDDDGSTYPSGLSFYDTTSAPTRVTELAGWYNTTSAADRCLAAIAWTNSAMVEFDTGNSGEILLFDYFICASTMNPDGDWQEPATSQSDAFLPVNAFYCMFEMIGAHVGAEAKVRMCLKENASVGDSVATTPRVIHLKAEDEIEVTEWVYLGASRQVLISGEATDDNQLGCYIRGYRITR